MAKKVREYESVLYFTRIQIKSEKKFRLFCKKLDEMEVEFGMRTTRINMNDCFFCPDVDWRNIQCNTAVEHNIRGIILQVESKSNSLESDKYN